MTDSNDFMDRADRLLQWIEKRYQGILIRRTTKPYTDHLLSVAVMARPLVTLGYEIGLCHDLLEDTSTTANGLLEALHQCGYSGHDALAVVSCVVELTDVYTAAAYPDLAKRERKKREAKRLLTISSTAQTVKYADLIYNIGWTLDHDQKHAAKYLKKKHKLLLQLNQGNPILRQKALDAAAGFTC